MAEETVAETQAEVVVETAQGAESVAEAVKHPLEPGGERFEEVIRQKNEARADAEFWRKQAETLRVSQAQPVQPQPQKKVYTVQELEQARTAGQISDGQMMDILAYQRAQEARQQTVRDSLTQSRQQEATREVREYLTTVPAAGNTSSPEFSKVAVSAYEIAEEMGLDVTDPRVQRRAFRETFGPLGKLASVNRAKDFSRSNADTHVESGGGGEPTRETNPLVNAPKQLVDHWKSLGYSEQRMKDELKYVNPRKWQ